MSLFWSVDSLPLNTECEMCYFSEKYSGFFRYTEEAGFFMAYIFFKCSLDGELWFHFLFPGQRSEL